MEALNIEQSESIPSDARVCSRHFPDGDALKLPSLSLGKRFASPRKRRAVVRLPKLEGKRNISVMADRGFTIQDQLVGLGVKLNIPPFMDGRKQLLQRRFSRVGPLHLSESTLSARLDA